MALPDRLEQLGIVVGSALLLAIPTSVLHSAVEPWLPPGLTAGIWFVPGLIVGTLVATNRIAVTYHQVWLFSISAWLLSAVGLILVLGVWNLSTEAPVALAVWALAFGVAALIASQSGRFASLYRRS